MGLNAVGNGHRRVKLHESAANVPANVFSKERVFELIQRGARCRERQRRRQLVRTFGRCHVLGGRYGQLCQTLLKDGERRRGHVIRGSWGQLSGAARGDAGIDEACKSGRRGYAVVDAAQVDRAGDSPGGRSGGRHIVCPATA